MSTPAVHQIAVLTQVHNSWPKTAKRYFVLDDTARTMVLIHKTDLAVASWRVFTILQEVAMVILEYFGVASVVRPLRAKVPFHQVSS